MSAPVLIVMSGLPATGKTTVGRLVARELGAAYVRIDTIETAITRCETGSVATFELSPVVGYAVGYEVAADQLRLGLSVVAECVNPLSITRDAWRDAGVAAGARVLEVELVCGDRAEHRRRLEGRDLDVAGLENPTWQQVADREYEPWDREHLILDTARLSAAEAALQIVEYARGDGLPLA